MFSTSNALYTLLDTVYPNKNHNITWHKISGLDIPFSASWKTIGINVSGGADSSCLAMLLGKIITDNNYDCKIHFITFTRCWNTRPWQGPIAVNVYNKLKEMYPGLIVERHINYIPPELEWGNTNGPILNGRSGDQIEGSSFNSYIAYTQNLDAVFNATSKNPGANGFDNRLLKRDKDAEDGKLEDVVFLRAGTYFCHPFRFVKKDWIVAQFFIHNAEDLYNTTRSCEGDINDGNAKPILPNGLDDYKPGMFIPLCGSCFWCLERSWAESVLQDTIKQITHD
jgi:hypothetical protein